MSNVSNLGDVYHWSVAKIAEAFGIDRKTVKRLLLDANIPIAGTVKGNSVFALKDVGPVLFGASRQDDPENIHDPAKMEPKERKDWYDSEKGRIWLEKELRQLIPEYEVTSVYAALVKTVIQQLETLPDRLERDAGMTPQAVSLVQKIIDDLRDNLFDSTYQASASAMYDLGDNEDPTDE